MSETFDYRPVYFQSKDGLRLFARDYDSSESSFTPLLCLPGLTRNSKDFETITPLLAKERRVIAVDFRGRGLSQYAHDPSTYRPDVELEDVIAVLDFLDLSRAAVIGTSRGGIIGMLMATFHRERLAGLLLNDIGPKLENAGLLRIGRHIGVPVQFDSWDAAVANLKSTNTGFESLTDGEWLAFARRVFHPENGVPRRNYDSALAQTFPSADEINSDKIPQIWDLFECTLGLPVSVLRGEHSDLLAAETVEVMQTRCPELDSTVVGNRGHAPFLDEPESKDAIQRWLDRVDARSGPGSIGFNLT